jgi:hypothetical protein
MKKALIGLCLFAASNGFGEEAVYRVIGGAAPVASAANGYVQQVRQIGAGEYEVHVATSLSPIGASGSYAQVLALARSPVPEGFDVPRSLARMLSPDLDAWEAATAILRWTAARLEIDDTDAEPQDAASVLRRGRGRCSGLANATVALLLTAGFEARTVSGLLVGDGAVIPHRWLECRLPAAGWVPSDPTLGLWTVTPRHLVYADTVTVTPRVEVVAHGDDGLERLPRLDGRLLRPNQGAGLVCRLPAPWSEPAPVAVLRGAGGEVRRARLDPEARFSGLLPGRWVLEVVSHDTVVERREFDLRLGDLHSFTVRPLAEQGRREDPGS